MTRFNVHFNAQETTFPENADPTVIPDKTLVEKEKQLLQKFSQLLQTFLNNQTDLQIVIVYAIQVFCYILNFPKGRITRRMKRKTFFLLREGME